MKGTLDVGAFSACVWQPDKHDSSFIIAATNRADAVDESVWRRFEIQITVELPGQFERERIIARYLGPYGLGAECLSGLAESFETATPALIRGFCENLKRQIVVGPKCGWDMRRDAVVERILAAVHPHPDCGKPRLWALGVHDKGLRAMPWPLPLAKNVTAEKTIVAAPDADNVVKFGGRA